MEYLFLIMDNDQVLDKLTDEAGAADRRLR
jgi:hypothetical protein